MTDRMMYGSLVSLALMSFDKQVRQSLTPWREFPLPPGEGQGEGESQNGYRF